ncbi:Fur-regulated basic protein FbpA [Sporolactobacillus terrae]|uniref:Fur-regulated basic protein FbpA n=1 Tax=Sporolactobacillus terrae TaxID=269673 RepID=A0A410DB80_9BACL|nr:Fur-regulated basic protein FbpA [Sporolactobacillus terrae]QAA23384.1 Fur-regulated basic protein FbpA [Sporolactobacillus terrae]QAA26355.1 Fur-regulated basic protein FbpA [Sporolactobacillus terrae]UAK15447.1 Fur-regulated basic protein FbpA [Sporolactobacillus terrae]BBN99808.1 hypothetical protein St703_25130 [Sporolactobacillus terrae]
MNSALRKTVENRREQLIERLIAHHVYKKNGKHLFELSLSELEHEYKQVQKRA